MTNVHFEDGPFQNLTKHFVFVHSDVFLSHVLCFSLNENQTFLKCDFLLAGRSKPTTKHKNT